jgi:RHS repeat-associated protein
MTGNVRSLASRLVVYGLGCSDADRNYKFTGKERDAESGLDMFGARYYASTMGRFMIPDWSSKPAAVPFADPANPQSLNLYSYVTNNPLSVQRFRFTQSRLIQPCSPLILRKGKRKLP